MEEPMHITLTIERIENGCLVRGGIEENRLGFYKPPAVWFYDTLDAALAALPELGRQAVDDATREVARSAEAIKQARYPTPTTTLFGNSPLSPEEAKAMGQGIDEDDGA